MWKKALQAQTGLKQRFDELLPDVPDSEIHHARLLLAAGLIIFAGGAFFLVMQLAAFVLPAVSPAPWSDIAMDTIVLLVGGLTLQLVRRGNVRLAAWALLGCLLLIAVVQFYTEGRPYADIGGTFLLFVLVTLAMVLLDRPTAWFVFGVTAATLTGIHLLWRGGHLSAPAARDLSSRALFSLLAWLVCSGIVVVVVDWTMGALRDQAKTLRQRVVEQKRAEKEIERRNKELITLNAVTSAVSQSLQLDMVLQAALEETLNTLDVQGGLVYLADRAGRIFTPTAHRGLSMALLQEVTGFQKGEGLSGRVAELGEPLVVADLPADPRNLSPTSVREGWRAYAGVPIKSKGRVLGVMSLVARQNNHFTLDHMNLLRHIGIQIGMAIENAQLYEQAQQEIVERRRAEEALLESYERFITVLDSIDAHIYVADLETMEILFMNRQMQDDFGGNRVGEICWEVFRGTSGPCDHCTNDKLLDADGNPTGLHVWEGQNPITGRWYINYDRAIKWIDGRLVHLQIATDITERKRTEEKVHQALQEKDTLLREIHHRVKNNLQLVCALLSLQADVVDDEIVIQAFRESQNRVRSMARIHEQLTHTQNLAQIDMQAYVQDLVNSLGMVYETQGITFEIDVVDVTLPFDLVSPCGLLINELVSNALKHAFPEGQGGKIRVALRHLSDECRVELTVSDDGLGLPAYVDLKDPKTLGLGLTLVGLLVQQLQGTLTLEGEAGTTFKVLFDVPA